MKNLNMVLMSLFLGMAVGSAYAGSSLCGDGTYDPIIGQYSGSHPDGTDATNIVMNFGGTGAISDAVFLGGGDWWTAQSAFPNGSPGFGTLTWKKIKKGEYRVIAMGLGGTPTPLSGFGVFPTENFYRAVAVNQVYLSSDCRQAEAYTTMGCFYNADSQIDPDVNHNVNTADPISCEDYSSDPVHLLTIYKVAP